MVKCNGSLFDLADRRTQKANRFNTSKFLLEIENCRGEGVAAYFFYKAKVTEPIALIVNNQQTPVSCI